MNGETEVRCPLCKGTAVSKYGKTGKGAQKYRCLAPGCRHQFDPNAKHISPVIKTIVAALIAEGVPTKKIHNAVQTVSKRWINEQRKSKG